MSLARRNPTPVDEPPNPAPFEVWARRVAEHGRTAATVSCAASLCVSIAAWMVTDQRFFVAPLAFAVACWLHLMAVFGLLVRLIAAEGEVWRRPWYRWAGVYALGANVTLCALFILGAALSVYFVPGGPSRSAVFAFSIAAWGTAGLPFLLSLPSYSTLWSLTLARFVRTEEDSRREELDRRSNAERRTLNDLVRGHRALLHRLARTESDPEHALAHAQALREFDEKLRELDFEEPAEPEIADPQNPRVWIDDSMGDPEFQPRSLHDER